MGIPRTFLARALPRPIVPLGPIAQSPSPSFTFALDLTGAGHSASSSPPLSPRRPLPLLHVHMSSLPDSLDRCHALPAHIGGTEIDIIIHAAWAFADSSTFLLRVCPRVYAVPPAFRVSVPLATLTKTRTALPQKRHALPLGASRSPVLSHPALPAEREREHLDALHRP
ncbi:hypothetical protein B0H12DRAFT_1236799 [Mycena haematopus]|nr:hypothetical protein B0H12DRAFT_1236799 [Mycena haematopus]